MNIPDPAELAARFTDPQPLTAVQAAMCREVRDRARRFCYRLSEMCPPSREMSLALTHLETAVQWATTAIGRAPRAEEG